MTSHIEQTLPENVKIAEPNSKDSELVKMESSSRSTGDKDEQSGNGTIEKNKSNQTASNKDGEPQETYLHLILRHIYNS